VKGLVAIGKQPQVSLARGCAPAILNSYPLPFIPQLSYCNCYSGSKYPFVLFRGGRVKNSLFICLLVTLFAAGLVAQDISGTIQGVVLDASGAGFSQCRGDWAKLRAGEK
jgi:hypothetical protein